MAVLLRYMGGRGTVEAANSQFGSCSTGLESQYYRLEGSMLYITILDQNANYSYEDLGGAIVTCIAPGILTMSNVDTFSFYLAQNGYNTSFTDHCKTGDETFTGIFITDEPDPNNYNLSGMMSYRKPQWACVYVLPPVTTTVIGESGKNRFTRAEYLSFFSSTSGSEVVTATSTSSIIFTILTPITKTDPLPNGIISYYTTTGIFGDLGVGTTTFLIPTASSAISYKASKSLTHHVTVRNSSISTMSSSVLTSVNITSADSIYPATTSSLNSTSSLKKTSYEISSTVSDNANSKMSTFNSMSRSVSLKLLTSKTGLTSATRSLKQVSFSF